MLSDCVFEEDRRRALVSRGSALGQWVALDAFATEGKFLMAPLLAQNLCVPSRVVDRPWRIEALPHVVQVARSKYHTIFVTAISLEGVIGCLNVPVVMGLSIVVAAGTWALLETVEDFTVADSSFALWERKGQGMIARD